MNSSPPPTWPTCWCGAACRSARRTESSEGWCGRRWTAAKLSELTGQELAELAPQLDGGFYELLDQGAWLESKVSDGGTALSRVRDQLAQARQVLREARR